ncbi:2OG-Fe(II) oxygenase [Pseudomonas sp. GD03858]|uniref:2OG-Fe(II) oxygenase n=1 Tax=unclassified Pseudomonas TaxID=196821 RepID=UPI00244D5A08|nr:MULTISPECIES: 2OG-Fe(II) oxygenase [unclassified Pseudomonas]MDH0649587.1 2OG-Fe(II) oxygenase [Pseudomonas sp. GD03867]MDH0665096.1 2OG-Fe(II) oxygenase [Pseudomonas sp. GD03858]
MSAVDKALDQLDWAGIERQLDTEGYAVIPGVPRREAGRGLMRLSSAAGVERETLESRGLGRGELLCFGAALPAPLAQWRAGFYRRLVAIANRWNETLGVDYRYPTELEDFLLRNRRAGQVRMQCHVSRLGVEDHVCLHQRNDGEHVFPLQIVALLSEPGVDFQGGEFVMTEQRPRMQSRPMVVPLGLGDLAIITTAQRPFKGAKGYYRVSLKHAISRVRQGERLGLELSFHDAP